MAKKIHKKLTGNLQETEIGFNTDVWDPQIEDVGEQRNKLFGDGQQQDN